MLATAQTTGQQHTKLKGTTRGQRPRRPRSAEATDWVHNVPGRAAYD